MHCYKGCWNYNNSAQQSSACFWSISASTIWNQIETGAYEWNMFIATSYFRVVVFSSFFHFLPLNHSLKLFSGHLQKEVLKYKNLKIGVSGRLDFAANAKSNCVSFWEYRTKRLTIEEIPRRSLRPPKRSFYTMCTPFRPHLHVVPYVPCVRCAYRVESSLRCSLWSSWPSWSWWHS